ncbi:hypothetical protein A2U01_0068643, partial [Trifolium medium]|nr:hypothetical protein [Trifolium medium]
VLNKIRLDSSQKDEPKIA